MPRLIATFFYIGYSPFAPGSAASLIGVLIFLGLHQRPLWYILCLAGITLLGFLFSGQMEKECRRKDPSCVVIDEVAGCLIAFYNLPATGPVLLTAYFLFRAFDMFKVFPVYLCERWPGSLGIMMDDVGAGLYTNITMQIALYWASHLISYPVLR